MQEQLTIYGKTKLEKFQDYHFNNPKVYHYFKKYALEMINKGFTRLSSKLIIERLRYEISLNSGEVYKINNNYTAYYSRQFVREYPQYYEYFIFKEVK